LEKLLEKYFYYKLPFLRASKRITIGPDSKIKADESSCPTT
jgi:hypothetical protein